MASGGEGKRLQLFDHLCAHYSVNHPETQGIIYCPLCAGSFRREDCCGRSPRLSLAHFIPESLGGTGSDCTLACSCCNGQIGTNLEAALVERFIADDFAGGIGKMDAKLSGEFGTISVEFDMATDRSLMNIYAHAHRSNPEHMKALEDYLKRATTSPPDSGFEIQAEYRHRPELVKAAIHHSAYLVMFSHFGYWFAAHPHYASLPSRSKSKDAENNSWTNPMFKDDRVTASIPVPFGSRTAVLFLREPSAILVVLRLKRRKRRGLEAGIERKVAVMLPGLDSSDLPTKRDRLNGSIIPYRPEMLLKKGSWFHAAWLSAAKAK